MEIKTRLASKIKKYCKLNDLDPDEYVNSILTQALTKDMYGDNPFSVIEQQNEVIDDAKKEEKVKKIAKKAEATEKKETEKETKVEKEEVQVEPKPRKRKLK